MKITQLLIIATLLCSIAVATINIPIIGWSTEKTFLKNEILSTYNADQFSTLLKSLVKGSKNDIVSSNKPELIIIYVENNLRTDELSTILGSYGEKHNGGQLHSLKVNMDHAASTLYIPYVDTHGSFVSSVISSLNTDGSIIVANSESTSTFKVSGATTYITIENINSALTNSIFTNGKTDILIVALPIVSYSNMASHNDIMKQVSELVNGKNTVSFYTAESATPVAFTMEYPSQIDSTKTYARMSLGATPNNTKSNSTSDYFNYFTGPVLETYLVVIILLSILFTGICCLADLQVPDRYEAPKQKIL